MSLCWPAIIRQEEWTFDAPWVGWFLFLSWHLQTFSSFTKASIYFTFFFFFSHFSWIVVYAHSHNSSLKIKNILKKSELMQWDCVKTRPKEQVDKQLRWQVGGRIYFSDLGHPQNAGRHCTGLLGFCTLVKRKWKARRDVEHGFRCQGWRPQNHALYKIDENV